MENFLKLFRIFCCGSKSSDEKKSDNKLKASHNIDKRQSNINNKKNTNENEKSKINQTRQESRNPNYEQIVQKHHPSNKTESSRQHNVNNSKQKIRYSKSHEIINIDSGELSKCKIERKSHENIHQSKIKSQTHSNQKIPSLYSERHHEENWNLSQNKLMKMNRNIDDRDQYKSNSNKPEVLDSRSNRKINNNENNLKILKENSNKINKENNYSNKESFVDSTKISRNIPPEINENRNRFMNNNKLNQRDEESKKEMLEISCDKSNEKIKLVNNYKTKEIKTNRNSAVNHQLKNNFPLIIKNNDKPMENDSNYNSKFRKKINYFEGNSFVDSPRNNSPINYDERNHLINNNINNNNKSYERNEEISENNEFNYKNKKHKINESIVDKKIGYRIFEKNNYDSERVSIDNEPHSLDECMSNNNIITPNYQCDQNNNESSNSNGYLKSPTIDEYFDSNCGNVEFLTDKLDNRCDLNPNSDQDISAYRAFIEPNIHDIYNESNNEDYSFIENNMKLTTPDSIISTPSIQCGYNEKYQHAELSSKSKNEDRDQYHLMNQENSQQIIVDEYESKEEDLKKYEEDQEAELFSENIIKDQVQSDILNQENSKQIISDINEFTEDYLKRLSFISTLSNDLSIGEKRGFENPKGFCFLNSVIQVLRGCKKFNSAILEYHKKSKIQETQENDQKKILFVIHFCTLLHKLKDDLNIDEQLKEIQNYFSSSSTGDDVNKCFMNLLSTINDVIKIKKPADIAKNEAEAKFQAFKNNNYGFVFDCFYGQFILQMTCEICKDSFNKKFQLFKCLALPVPNTDKTVPLEKCIKIFFKKSMVDIDEPMKCKCPNGTRNISSECQITHCPIYLFIYLDRGSLILEGVKKDTFIKCSEYISIKTINGDVQYRIISVIDHLGTSENGHYYCKCNYEGDNWWLLNDSQATLMGKCDIGDIITKNTIVFMFKKEKNLI